MYRGLQITAGTDRHTYIAKMIATFFQIFFANAPKISHGLYTFDFNVHLHLEHGTAGSVGHSCHSPYRHTQLLCTQDLSNEALAVNSLEDSILSTSFLNKCVALFPSGQNARSAVSCLFIRIGGIT